MTGSSSTEVPEPTRLGDYRPFPFRVTDIELRFELDVSCTRVHSRLSIERLPGHPADTALVLDGAGLDLDYIAIDGRPLGASGYQLTERTLTIPSAPARFCLDIDNTLAPNTNEGDEGLFVLDGKLATQCESEGFRRLTWFPDRPDVLSRYRVTLVGDPQRYPVMLSNGNPVESGLQDDGRHWVRWEDPFAKPCYIFAIVAGDFGVLTDTFVTCSGRNINLNIYADHDRSDECQFAMGALKRALAWEEEKYRREYDLDTYNIVALTGHVGAMENKGLNIFDANGICADPTISTDQDYRIIERILAHEVFHNWSGNRITCRDWFQLSLKEGLTRFRDQVFSQDMGGAGVKRIEFVRALQRNQFPEDDGPACHPVKPDSYIEIRNFYTGTVYDKGAEVIRMLSGMLGDALFRKAVIEYFQRFDLQAVTVEDFLQVVAVTGGRDLSQFYRWYHQAGRPRVTAEGEYDATSQQYTLTLRQRTDHPKWQDRNKPFAIPVLAGLLTADGEPMQVSSEDAVEVDGNLLLELKDQEQVFRFADVTSKPTPSLLRGFSAPVSLDVALGHDELALLWAHDQDAFNRWQSGQKLAIELVRSMANQAQGGALTVTAESYLATWSALLEDRDTDPGLLAELLLLPDEPALSDGLPVVDVDGHESARSSLLQRMSQDNRALLLERYHELEDVGRYQFNAVAVGRRSLRNRCLEVLLASPTEDLLSLCLQQLHNAGNMTERFAALLALCQVECPQRESGLQDFYAQWQHKPPVIDKWFNAQALIRSPQVIDRVLELEQHPAMDIGNMPRAMAFYGGFFRQNRIGFHAIDGRAYDMLADRVIAIDATKPGTTYWLMPQLLQWRRYDALRREKMRAALEKILAADISPGLFETVSNALAPEN